MKKKLTYADIYDTKLMEEDGVDVDETIKRIMEIDRASDNDGVIRVPDAEWRLKTDKKYRICPVCGKHAKGWEVSKFNTIRGEREGYFMLKCFKCTLYDIMNSFSDDTGMC